MQFYTNSPKKLRRMEYFPVHCEPVIIPIPKPKKRYCKKRTLQTSIPHEHVGPVLLPSSSPSFPFPGQQMEESSGEAWPVARVQLEMGLLWWFTNHHSAQSTQIKGWRPGAGEHWGKQLPGFLRASSWGPIQGPPPSPPWSCGLGDRCWGIENQEAWNL